MVYLEEASRDHTLLLVNVCLDYSGQWDIAQSCITLMKEYHLQQLLDESDSSLLQVEKVADRLASNLSTGNSPVDVVIRTGGEHRISNFLLWQISYAEISVVDMYWPDFTKDIMKNTLDEIAKRNRRFGK